MLTNINQALVKFGVFKVCFAFLKSFLKITFFTLKNYFKVFNEVWLIYNAGLVSGVQQSDSVTDSFSDSYRLL